MPPLTVQYGFSGGEVSETFRQRADINRYFLSLEVCENFVPLPKGGIRRRYGTELIEVLPGVSPCRLEPFEFSIEQSYMLAFGEQIVRVYDQRGPQLTSVTTPYLAADLFQLHMVQSADVQFHAHPNYPPAVLARTAATTFVYNPVTFRPQPYVEADTFFNTSLTLSATTGAAVTFTTAAATWQPADVDRQIVSGLGRAVITGFTSTTVVTGRVLTDFASVGPIAAGEWALTGSPVATATATKTGPVGAVVRVNLQRPEADAPNLIPDGDFGTGQGGWQDYSGALLASGTATAGSDASELFDTSATFLTAGVEISHVALNTSIPQNPRSNITAVVSETQVSHDGGTTFATGNTYEIRNSGTATFTGGEATLRGGANGLAWIERDVPTVIGRTYEVKRDVRQSGLSMQIGSTSQASDLFAESTTPIGNAITDTFTATTTTSYVQFRNNQNTTAVVDNVAVRDLTVEGFRAEDVGKLIAMNNGVIEITSVVAPSEVEGIVWGQLDAEQLSAVAGRWVLGVPAWSAARGYPRTLTFHDGRLSYLGTRQQPLTRWASVVGLFDNFALGIADDAALEDEISSNQMNAIEWAEPFQDLLIGTRGGEHTLTGGNLGRITPTNKAQVPQTVEGSAPLRPIRSGNRLFHVARGRRRIGEFRVQETTNLFSEPTNITLLAEHITRSGIIQWAYQDKPERTLWAVRADGVLIGYSFELAEEVQGWHRHVTQGVVESVAIRQVDEGTPEETEEVWLCVNRNGTRCLEVMRPKDEQGTISRAALTVDSAVRYTLPTPTTTFTGLDHLNGRTVRLVARDETTVTNRRGETQTVDRLINVGTAVVHNGQVLSPEPYARMDIGLDFTSRAIPLPPEQQRQDGSIKTRKARWIEVAIEVFETIGLTVDGVRLEQQRQADLTDTYIEPRTETLRGHGEGWDESPQLVFEQREPFPCTILSFTGELEVEEVE